VESQDIKHDLSEFMYHSNFSLVRIQVKLNGIDIIIRFFRSHTRSADKQERQEKKKKEKPTYNKQSKKD
jgi:hypothetical protein